MAPSSYVKALSLFSHSFSPPPPTHLVSSFSPSSELRSQFRHCHCTRGVFLFNLIGHMTRGDRVEVGGDRGRGDQGTRGRRGPRKMTGVPLDLGETDVGTSTPPGTSTPVVPTPSLSEGLPAMRMIPTPGSRVQSSETPGSRSQRQTLTQATTEDDDPPPPKPDSKPWPLVDNPLPEGRRRT
ncbi:hypothetical protein PIB30_011168 [Stylosanthes scabra]|uniref:Uncharacterized protein n=1 Tax=Stylosanthes scabra TaxID=79078 RepID=A0ABU6R4L4_9FABA|nr:hypothetical protein [Stylosanthes scabra]